MTTLRDAPAPATPPDRWTFVRDVLVFQLKLLLGNLLNFVMLPVTVVTAVYDLVGGNSRRDAFYKTLDVGRDIEERINIYGVIGGYHATGSSMQSGGVGAEDVQRGSLAEVLGTTTVDDVVRRVEDAVRREVREGATAASVKAAVDRVLESLRKR